MKTFAQLICDLFKRQAGSQKDCFEQWGMFNDRIVEKMIKSKVLFVIGTGSNVEAAMIGWPVVAYDPEHHPLGGRPDKNGNHFFVFAVAAETQARKRLWSLGRKYLKNHYPNVTHLFGYREGRVSKLYNLRKGAV